MGKMRVSVRSSSMVKPAEETWNGCLPLSEWDQVGSVAHVPTIYFYKAPPQNWFTILRDSLSRLLAHFYPVAGRLRSIGGGRVELLCNGEGVELIEAESDAQLQDYGDHFENLIPRVDYEIPIQELPLLLVQLTRFSCGSISIATTMSHVIADGLSAFHFHTKWARLARGEPLGAAPFLDRMILQNRSNVNQAPTTFDDDDIALMFDRPPLLIGQTSDRVERKKATKTEILKLTTKQVEALKKQAAANYNQNGRGANYSCYEVLTAHAWKCACKARQHKSAQPTAVGLCVDTRQRMVPPLPENYFGNAIVDVVARSRAGEIASKPLGFACSRIREAIGRVTDDYVNSATRFLKNQSDLSRFQYEHLKGVGVATSGPEGERPYFGNPNIAVTTWVKLPIHGLDFGWGEEINMAPGSDDLDGGFVLLPSREGDGSILVSVCLQVPRMDAFKKFFYEDIHTVHFENQDVRVNLHATQLISGSLKLTTG